MKIEELAPGQAITLLARIGEEKLQFTSSVLEILPRKHVALAEPIFHEDRVLSFRGKNLIVDMLVVFEDEKPQLFKNVSIELFRREDDSIVYQISSLAESKVYNRRGSFRCYVGLEAVIQAGPGKAAHDAILKDVSADGFSIVCSSSLQFCQDQLIHTVLNDYLDELAETFSFRMQGLVVRSQSLDDDRSLYGCRLNSRVPGLEAYIVKKERLRLKRLAGSL